MIDSPEVQTLKKYLSDGSAAVIVGAGFSRNAERKEKNKPLPPLWDGFMEAFAKGILGVVENSDENDKKIAKYVKGKSPVVLTQEFESLFGRKAMVDLVRKLVGDSNLIPGEVHQKLLRLPWADVYTTNYDTLLERAAVDIHEYDYQTITLPSQIVGSKNPRIVKLHGTWHGHEEDWVVTEEDYRNYPDRRAPFVNMVRQSAMEACLCLIGFSGTDPNFLAWIGWVRDYLGDTQLPIFLVLCNPPSPAEILLLKRRNIVVICLSLLFPNVKRGDYALAYSRLFDQLMPEVDSNNKLPIPELKELDHNLSKKDLLNLLKTWVGKINAYRRNFVGYVVLPYADRESINASHWHYNVVLQLLAEMDLKEKIHVCCALEWFRSNGLRNMPRECYSAYCQLLKSVQESGEVCSQDELDELRLTLWQAAREQHDVDMWKSLDEFFKKNPPADRNAVCYERVLMYMSDLDISRARESLAEWEPMEKSEEWQLKYASVLMRMCRFADAAQIVKQSLRSIRRKIPRGRRIDHRYFLQLEGIALCLLRTLSWNSESGVVDADYGAIQKRLDFLSGYNCNPLRDVELYNLAFERQFVRPSKTQKKRNFDQTVITKQVFAPVPEHGIKVGEFIHFVEKTGLCRANQQFLPIDDSPGSTRCEDFIRWYSYVYPKCAGSLNWWFAIGGEKLLNVSYSEAVIDAISCYEAEHMAQGLLASLEEVMALDDKDPLSRVKARLARFLTDVLSRIVHKVPESDRRKIFEAGVRVFRHPVLSMDQEIFVLRKRFFSLTESSLSRKSIVEFLPDILEAVSCAGYSVYESERLAPLENLPVVGVKEMLEGIPDATRKYVDSLVRQFVASIGSEFESDLVLKLAYVEAMGLMSRVQRKAFAKRLLIVLLGDVESRLKLTQSYLQDILSIVVRGSAVKILDLTIRRQLKRLPESPLEFNSDEIPVYQDLIGGYGFIRHGCALRLSTKSTNAIYDYVVKRVEGQLAKCKDRGAFFEQFGGENIRNCWIVLDRLIAEVLLPVLPEGKKKEVWSVMEKTQCIVNSFPMTRLSFSLIAKDYDAVREFVDAIDLYDNDRITGASISALSICGSIMSGDESMLDYVVRYLIEVVRHSPNDTFKGACNALAILICLHPRLNTAMSIQDVRRIYLQTRFGVSSRFDESFLRDYQESAAYLLGVIWSASGHRRDECLVVCKDNGAFPSEIRSWEQGVAFAKRLKNL